MLTSRMMASNPLPVARRRRPAGRVGDHRVAGPLEDEADQLENLWIVVGDEEFRQGDPSRSAGDVNPRPADGPRRAYESAEMTDDSREKRVGRAAWQQAGQPGMRQPRF